MSRQHWAGLWGKLCPPPSLGRRCWLLSVAKQWPDVRHSAQHFMRALNSQSSRWLYGQELYLTGEETGSERFSNPSKGTQPAVSTSCSRPALKFLCFLSGCERLPGPDQPSWRLLHGAGMRLVTWSLSKAPRVTHELAGVGRGCRGPPAHETALRPHGEDRGGLCVWREREISDLL